MNNDNVAALARDWLSAKAEESAAAEKRIAIEEQLSSALDVPAEGSTTHKIKGYKIVLTQPIYRKVDMNRWAEVADECPNDLVPIRTKFEADATGIKWLIDNRPKVWKKIASAFETKPGKINFKIEAK